jgi:hypothetical protein
VDPVPDPLLLRKSIEQVNSLKNERERENIKWCEG